jgi:hypothetical protein
MITKLHNDYVTGRHDIYHNCRVSAFALVNNWHIESEKSTYNSNFSGASFMQSGSKSSGPIACWGCGKEGVTLYQCTNPSRIKKNKVKQERKQASYNQGQQHFNIKIDDRLEGKQHINMKIAKSGETENIKNESDTEYFGYDVGVSFK